MEEVLWFLKGRGGCWSVAASPICTIGSARHEREAEEEVGKQQSKLTFALIQQCMIRPSQARITTPSTFITTTFLELL